MVLSRSATAPGVSRIAPRSVRLSCRRAVRLRDFAERSDRRRHYPREPRAPTRGVRSRPAQQYERKVDPRLDHGQDGENACAGRHCARRRQRNSAAAALSEDCGQAGQDSGQSQEREPQDGQVLV